MCTLCRAFGSELEGFWHSEATTTFASETDGEKPIPVFATSENQEKTNPANQEVDGLLYGTRWVGTVTYSFTNSPSDYPSGYGNGEPTSGFGQISATQRIIVDRIMGQIEAFTNLNIARNDEVGISDSAADIRIANSSMPSTAWAYMPSSSYSEGGDVWFGTSYNYGNPVLGSYAYATHIHELGHSFGLKHSHVGGGVSNTAVPSAHDALEFTVMSYRSYVGDDLKAGGYTNEQFGYPQTFMMNDILALQTMYGADYTLNSSDTVYKWNTSTGQMSINGIGQATPGANRVFLTIWDGGGTDTYDLSNYTNNTTIDLRPASFSTTSSTQKANLGSGHYAQGNVYNAYLYYDKIAAAYDVRSYIENAIGGNGNDTIIGNAASNRLTGGAADDLFIFYGIGGNDVITDFTAGAGGIDEIYLFEFSTIHSFTEALAVASQVGQDTVFNFGTGATLTLEDVVLGNLTSGDFRFTGYTIVGTSADDRIDTTDTAPGQNLPSDSDDTISGLAGNDTIHALDGNDTITGGAGNDQLFGEAGDDIFLIAKNDAYGDVVDGGDGTDTFQVTGRDNVKLSSFAPSNDIESWVGNTKAVVGDNANNVFDFSNLTYVSGLLYVDGGAGNDTIIGTAFADDLRGGKGMDRLVGGAGDDKLMGGDSADTFVFEANSGQDKISSFTPGEKSGHDVIEFDSSVFANFADVMSHAAQVNKDVVITHDANNTITLQSMTLTKLVAADFQFV